MTVKGGPKIVSDGLVFNLDAAGAVSNKAYPINGLSVEYLIVAGGGGGGGVIGGGGGAGGLLNGFNTATIANGDYAIVVGAGGAGGTGWNTVGQGGNLGGDSSVFSITSTGGGGGVHHGSASTSTNRNGGSGGGGANPYSGQGGTGIAGQGNNGGNNGTSHVGAGGGGAGSVGGNAGGSYGGSGGLGKYYGYSFGRSVGYDGWFADGGAGGVRGYVGTFVRTATHGGGSGTSTTTTAGNGSTNTGSGGGGGGYNGSSSSRIGGNGGSGVVIIRYKGSQKASGGDSIFNYKGFTVHVFTSSGTFTVGGRVGGLSTSKIVGTLNNMGSSNYSSANKGYFTFDGSNEYIQTPSINLNYNAITISAWIYKSSNATVYGDGIISKSASSKREFHFRIAYSPQNGIYFWKSANGGGADYQFDTNIAISLNQWQNVVVTMNTTNVEFYLNGNNVKSYSGSYTMYNGDTPMYIGKWAEDNGWMFGGRIASVSVHNRVLSANEVEQNYNATKGRFGL